MHIELTAISNIVSLDQSLRGGRSAATDTLPVRPHKHTSPSLNMPPSIPAAPLRSLSHSTTTTARSTTASLLRGFSTTPSRRDIEIPPESPRFIPLPDLPQSNEDKKPFPKGHLPVPREIFTRRANMAHKLQPNFVADTAPRSKAEHAGLPPKSDKDAWKRLMAESRRQALGGGITSLWRRKNTRDKRAKTRADAKAASHLADKTRPDRLDDIYTRGTVTQATLATEVVRDPEYEAKQLMSQARTAAVHKSKSEARKDAVQRLYVEAGKFILTEEELTAKVDKVFDPSYFVELGRQSSNAWYGPMNMWEARGRPLSTSQMFGSTVRSGQRSDDYEKSSIKKTETKQRIIAGELTGGALAVTGLNTSDYAPTPDPGAAATEDAGKEGDEQVKTEF